MHLFPKWAEILDLDATVEGRDLPLGAEPAAYRDVVAEILGDDSIRGALVTTHKVGVIKHAADLFGELDDNARLCREVSCISKRAGRLIGHAKDPITAGRSLGRFVPRGARLPGVLCLGAGGAGTAITVCLLRRDPGPKRLAVVDREPGQIENLRAIHSELGAGDVEYHVTDEAAANDRLLESLPPGSLIINATGMGKDTPGSPLTDDALFPHGALGWELNYRGELDFLRQARRRAPERNLVVIDGWDYFLHGWIEVIAEVFDVAIGEGRFARLATAAAPLRPH